MLDKLLHRLPEEPRRLLAQARHDLHVKGEEGRVALWSLSTQGLERAHDVLAGEHAAAPAALARPLLRVVDRSLRQATALPVPGYDELNARSAAAAVRGLHLLDLERIARHERAHKDRKTVHAAVAQERSRLLAPPTPVPEA